MSAEDRLRDILRTEAATVVPSGDGLARIRERAAARRRFRLMALPGAGLIAAAVVVAVIALSGTSGTQRLDGPATRVPTATPTPTVTTTPGVEAPYTGPMLWPFTSVEQGQSWMTDHGRRPWAGDALQVTQHFLTDLLGLDGVTATGDGPMVTLTVQGHQVGVVHLVRVFRGGPWTVVSVCCTDLTITAPAPGAAITSPTAVTGRVTGVDESVELRLVPAGGEPRDIAAAFTGAGSALPWHSDLTWTDQAWFTGGIVAITRSPRDGSINRIAVVVVKRGRA